MANQLNAVSNLTDEIFWGFLAKHDLVLVAFVWPWLPSVKRLNIVYGQAATKLNDANDVKFAWVDLTKEKEISERFPLSQVPTITLFKEGEAKGSYTGPWILSDLVFYARRQTLPVLSPISVDSLHVLKKETKVLVVGYFGDEDASSKAAFSSIANAHHRDFVFGLCTDQSLADLEGVPRPGIILYKDFDDRQEIFKNGRTDNDEAIWSFVKLASTPLIVDFRPEVHRGYLKAGLPLGYILLGEQSLEQRSRLEAMIHPLAKQYRSRIQFGIVDAQVSKQIVEDMHLNSSPNAKWPTFAIRNPAMNHRFLFDRQGQTIPSQPELSEYLESFFNGSLRRDIKSEPAPEEPQHDAAQTIVGLTFDTLVLNNSDKDVFVEFYTQSCGPCKAMAPQWEKLAQLYKDDERGCQMVMIGKIDAEANDVPWDVRGYPWLLLYPAGKKDAPVQYIGNRTVEDMALFVKEYGTFGVDIMAV